MSEWFKSKLRMTLLFGVLVLTVTAAAWGLAIYVPELIAVDASPVGSEPVSEPGSESSSEPGEETPPEQEPEPEPEPAPPEFRVPAYLRGAFLTPGVDYLKNDGASESTVKAEIDNAISNAKKLTMNSLILLTDYGDGVIYDTADASSVFRDFDIMDYIVRRCREENLYTYAVFNASHYNVDNTGSIKMAVGVGTVNSLSANLREFAGKYGLDGILIDGYVNEKSGSSYKLYTLLGSAIGYDNYMRYTPEVVVTTAAKAIRKAAPSTQVGLLADAVWANADEVEAGSATKASFTALGSGNADTKAFVQSGMLDFVAVKAYGSLTSTAEPFGEVANWWAEVSRDAGVTLYVVQASSKACTQESGWAPHDQLTKQAIALDGISGVRGAMFDSLARMVEDPKESATTLIKYYRQEVQAEHILTELAITKPDKTTFTTTEPTVTFTGASDPNSVVTINGEVIQTDASGYFTIQKELVGGDNKFVIEHKEKVLTYVISRMVEVVREVTPQGTLKADGSMDITITALAYYDAEVYASINNTTVRMEIDDSVVDEADRDSNYKLFVGSYTAPPATSSEQNLGQIIVTGSWQGETKSLTGATVIINKKARIEDGVPVVVIADQAQTFPANTLDNIPHASYYPLPKGAMDYAVGDEITYVNYKGITYKFYVLASGLRVQSKDIQVSSDFASGNAIDSLSMKVENGFTYVTLPMTQQVSYTLSYKTDSVSVLFHNTIKSPSTKSLPENPLFTEAVWSNNCTLDLKLVKRGGFMGYKAYFDEHGNLVLRFNNPPASISSARIAIDPGHGGNDTGALGFLRDYPERVLNKAIAAYLKQELENRGATVLLIDQTSNPSLENRVRQAEQFNADMFISVHNNSAANASAAGTEVYYFYPFSWSLASSSSSNVSGQLATANRGAKQSYYAVTLSSQFQSVLVECGFMSNKNEYEKLIKSSYQQKIAVGIADSIQTAIKATYPGISGGGSATADSPSQSGGGQGEAVAVESVSVTPESLTLRPNETATLTAKIKPSDADDQTVLWRSGKTSIATVDKNGKVTAVGVGSTTITVTTVDGDYSAAVSVTVSESASSGGSTSSGSATEKAEDVWFVEDYYTLLVKKTVTLEIDSDIGKLPSSDFDWESSDDDIATVSKSGVVTAGSKEGDVTIFAFSKDGRFDLECDITVTKARVSVENVWLSENDIVMVEGSTWSGLGYEFSPSSATSPELEWSSSSKSRVTVDQKGALEALKSGSATITLKIDGKKATCGVEVIKSAEIEDLYLDYNDYQARVGETFYLEYELEPYFLADQYVTWTSSNPSVVSVDSSGKLRALKAGTATITCTSIHNTKCKDICEITVS